METVFLVCVAVGGTLLVCQFLLTLLGMGHHDFDHDHDVGHHECGHDHDQDHERESWFVGVLTFRSLVAAVTFFGLGGLVAFHATEEEPLLPLGVAVLSGGAALLLVGWMMKVLQRLKAEGNVHIGRAVGTTGTVYLSVPGKNNGTGKVTVKVQNRTVEYQAVTNQEMLATGTPIQVIAVVGPDTVEVVSAAQS